MSSLYIHIPFCRSKCIYCDFYSRTGKADMELVTQGLIDEFRHRCNEVNSPFTTIYIGGGTPSVLPISLLEKLVATLPTQQVEEFTIEVNPDDVTPQSASAWHQLGINRVSMGVQTLNDSVLRSIGRRHTGSQALQAIDTLIGANLTNISVDLIYGLPGIEQHEWEHDLSTIVATPVTHLSAYCLSYYPGTMLHKLAERGRITPTDDDQLDLRFRALQHITSQAGFDHYEISNLARPGYRSRHNSAYWNPGHTWLGIGPSAHSFDGRVRRADHSDIASWLRSLPAPFEEEHETPLDLINDNIVTALRTSDGLDLNTIPEPHRSALMRNAAPIIATGALTLSNHRLSIPSHSWLTSDYYLRQLIID